MKKIIHWFYGLFNKKQDYPCRAHYWAQTPISNCKECGWSSPGVKKT